MSLYRYQIESVTGLTYGISAETESDARATFARLYPYLIVASVQLIGELVPDPNFAGGRLVPAE